MSAYLDHFSLKSEPFSKESEAAAAVDAGSTLPGVLENGLQLFSFGGGGPAARFICGFLACDAQLSPSFLGGLPALIRINLREDPAGQWLENSLRLAPSVGRQLQGVDSIR